MSINNSPKIMNGINTIKNISDQFKFTNHNDSETELEKLIFNFFKTFNTYISYNKNPSQKLKFSPEFYEAKNDYNIAKIYEKEGKLFLKSFNYENEFDKFFTQINRVKEQKRKTRQSLKNGSLVYEIPLYKKINLNELNNKLYEDVILNNEIKYDVFNSVFFPKNERSLNKDSNLIFNLNQKMSHNSNGLLLLEDNSFINFEDDQNNNDNNENKKGKNDKDNNIHKQSSNLPEAPNALNLNENNINISKINAKSIYFNECEIMLEISKYENFIQDNISLYLLNLCNSQNMPNNIQTSISGKIENLNNPDILYNFKEIINTVDNTHMLDLINHFNNIFTPTIYNKFSFYKNIKINNQSITLNDINSIFKGEKEDNSNIEKDEEKLMNDIKKYFDEELVKEINKDIEITQNFTHFYIEGNKFSKENIKKIISFLSKEKYFMFAWCYNKEETKKYGLINNVIKVANLSDKVWFYINRKNCENNNQ